MEQITLPVMRHLAHEFRTSAMLMMQFGDGKFHFVSYGMTRAKCEAMRTLNERIAKAIEEGTIELPDGLDS